MKKTFRVIVAFACVALVCSCSGKKSEAPKGENYQISDSQLAAVQKAVNGGEKPAQKAKSIDELLSVESTQMDSLSYCLGANMGIGIKQQFADTPFDLDVVKVGIIKGFAGVSEQTHEEAIDVLYKFFSEEFGKRQAEYQKAVAADSTAVFNPFTSKKECKEVSYSFGNDIGTNLKNSKLPIKLNWLWNGFQAGWNGDAAKDQDKILKFLNHYFMTVVPAQNAARSKAWIEAKKQEEGVQTTESGLAYKVIEAGDMSKAAKNNADMVKVHYVGKLQDGTVFDASRFEDRSKEQQKMIRKQQPSLFDDNGNPKEESEPIEFPLNRVIKGWTEGMKLVGPGGKIVLYIPADLAYGRMGGGQLIGPNEALEFEVELIDVTPTEVEPKDPSKDNVRPLPTKKPVKK